MPTQNITSGLLEASTMPVKVSDAVPEIAEDALQAAFAVIATRMKRLGYPVSGDMAPDESVRLDSLFQGFVLSMALNNPTIAGMQDSEASMTAEQARKLTELAGHILNGDDVHDPDLTTIPGDLVNCVRIEKHGARGDWSVIADFTDYEGTHRTHVTVVGMDGSVTEAYEEH